MVLYCSIQVLMPLYFFNTQHHSRHIIPAAASPITMLEFIIDNTITFSQQLTVIIDAFPFVLVYNVHLHYPEKRLIRERARDS